MCAPMHGQSCGCNPHCGCGGTLTIDEEIRAMEVHRQHLKFQLDMVDRRIESLKNAGK